MAPFLSPSDFRIAYVGPGRSTNLGDACMLDAYRMLLPDWEISVVPHGDAAFKLKLIDSALRGRTISGIALGGGTLIGSHRYRTQLDRLLALFPDVPALMFGVGVEDPVSIVSGHSLTSDAELSEWRNTLARFSAVHVRGPRSQQILDAVGVPSSVVGDSALILGDVAPSGSYEPGLLGLNIGVSEPIWGGDPGRVWQAVVGAGRDLVAAGWRIRVLPVWPNDLEYCKSASDAIGPASEMFVAADWTSFTDSVRECDVFVGQKLHSVILANSVHVPSVMLEYRPKCLDYQLSIGREQFTIRTDVVTSNPIVEMVNVLSDFRSTHQLRISSRLTQLRDCLVLAADASTSALTAGR